MGLFKNSYEGMQWFEQMSEEEKQAYLARHHQTPEYQEQEADLYYNDFYAWDRNRGPVSKIFCPMPLPPHPFYGKTAGEKAVSLFRWIW